VLNVEDVNIYQGKRLSSRMNHACFGAHPISAAPDRGKIPAYVLNHVVGAGG
jgi:hypothetical protein